MRTSDVVKALAIPIVVLATATVTAASQVTVPNRPTKPLFHGQPGEARSPDLLFDPATRTVTLKLSVQDVNGFFVPNLRRSNFAVDENGVRPKNATVQVDP